MTEKGTIMITVEIHSVVRHIIDKGVLSIFEVLSVLVESE